MGSFEDRPSTVKNTKGLKKLQFDEIMKGITYADADGSSKRSATIALREKPAAEGEADQSTLTAKAVQPQLLASVGSKKPQASKTFFAPSKATGGSKKVPMTTKH